jgi:pSer/pThr/pTyr-binding forkhead associated (FHA) protein
MSELTLLILRLLFLGLMWVFVFMVLYALRTDLFGQKVQRMPEAAAAPFAPVTPPIAVRPRTSAATPQAPASSGESSLTATRLVITGGAKQGLEMSLPPEQLAIGRASESGLVIRDDYTSTHHAKLLLWKDGWVIQDLESTNGTFLDGVRVIVPTQVPINTTVKIGTTSFELRR